MFNEPSTSRPKLPLLKIRPGVEVEVVIRARHQFAYMVHWIGRKSLLCPGSDCDACSLLGNARWQCVIPVELRKRSSKVLYLLELSSGAFDFIDGLRRFEGFDDLLGLVIAIKRQSQKAPLRADLIDRLSGDRAVDEVQMWVNAFGTIYNLPLAAPGETQPDWFKRCEIYARHAIAQHVDALPVNGTASLSK